MKAARIVVLAVALGAGGVAALLATRSEKPPEQPPAQAQIPSVEVLVAKGDISLGQTVSGGDMQWVTWPANAALGNFITKNNRPDAMGALSGSIARAPFVAGEPIRPAKLIKGNGSGFLSAILPAGMRAVATKIAVDTAAGGFILPNDRVDVILTRRDAEMAKATGVESWTSETILKNVRVLAIDQAVEDKDGQKVITGSTATLELAPQQTEVLALGKEMGSLSLTLRSLADSSPTAAADTDTDNGNNNRGLSIVRYGVPTTVVNR
jgi:pilus assembly protein CpaB